jgi:mono/diheme cytochrome c family protein
MAIRGSKWRRKPVWRWAALGLGLASGWAMSAPAESRGELLYETHCIACHSSQMHWRDQRVATDWRSLQREVRRWQQAAALAWTDADIRAVTGFLNDTIYRYPPTDEPAPAPDRLAPPSGTPS